MIACCSKSAHQFIELMKKDTDARLDVFFIAVTIISVLGITLFCAINGCMIDMGSNFNGVMYVVLGTTCTIYACNRTYKLYQKCQMNHSS